MPYTPIIVECFSVIDIGIDIIGSEVVMIEIIVFLGRAIVRIIDMMSWQAIDALWLLYGWIERIGVIIRWTNWIGVDCNSGIGRWRVIWE